MKNKIIIVGALIAVIASYLILIDNNEVTAADSQGQEVYEIKSVSPAVTGKIADFTWMENGKAMSFNDYTKDKIVFLNFWGTWCPPCRREIPDIIKISKELEKEDFVVIGIALERNPSTAVQQVGTYMKAKGINYKNFVNADQLVRAYGGIQAVPTTFIIGKDGKVGEKIVGGRNYKQFMASINKVMKAS